MSHNGTQIHGSAGLLTWSSPKPISRVEGYALAICLLVAGQKKDGVSREKRKLSPPTTLTPDLADEIAGNYAFIRNSLKPLERPTFDDVHNIVADASEDDIEKWLEENDGEIERARTDLDGLVSKGGSLGFRCLG
jgi:hypothetical protein